MSRNKKIIETNENTESLDELSARLNSMIKSIMGRRTASTIAKKCGVSVSTITRIRNGENKRGIREDLLHNIWKNRDSDCDIDLSQLLSLNSDVSNAYMQKEDAKWTLENQEIDDLEKKIQKSIFNSGVFLRRVSSSYEIIPDIYLYPEMSYEIAFESGEKRHILFYTQLYSKSKIERLKKQQEEYPDYKPYTCRHYRTIMDFEELRALHKEYDNAELVIVFNHEEAFRYNIEIFKKLSNTQRVTLALIDGNIGRIQEEVCLDDRKSGVLEELKLVYEKHA